MRLRAAHLAFVMLLLSSLGATEVSAVRSSRGGVNGQTIGVLLQQIAPALYAAMPFAHCIPAGTAVNPIASPAPLRAAWAMRPPAAHSAHQHAVTATRA